MQDEPISIFRMLLVFIVLGFIAIMTMEYLTLPEQARLAAGDQESPLSPGLLRLAAPYLSGRSHVMERWWLYFPLPVVVPMVLFVVLRKLSAATSRLKELITGMDFKQESDCLPNRVARKARSIGEEISLTQNAFVQALAELPSPETSVLLGLDQSGEPVTMTDRQRSMHMQILGQTGSGKTQSVIYPLLFQDARRLWEDPSTKKKVHRPIVFIDAKGSIENEQMLASIASATGRKEGLRIFSLNPGNPTHTYNPLHLSATDDPRQVAERVFSTFEGDLDVQYYKDMARELWVNLICVMASSGKQMTMLDAAAAISNRDVMREALSMGSDRTARRAIQSRYDQLGTRAGETYTGLLAAVNRYDHPAVNVYNPDIILDELFAEGGMVGFSLSANAYKYQAKSIGLIVLQHIQHIGAQRQMDRSLCQVPAYIYADEFYTFSYQGFVDAVNKLRDANLSMLLSHQSMSDLDLVSPEFAQGIWDNTRNRIILFQNDGDLCDRIAGGVGTKKSVALTVRKSTDDYLNQESMLEASSREVDEYILHPNQIKHLKMGQAYLVQSGLAEPDYEKPKWWRKTPEPTAPTVAVGVNLALMPPLPPAAAPPPKRRDTTSGIGLHNMFVGQSMEEAV